jgi:hypothetical protein
MWWLPPVIITTQAAETVSTTVLGWPGINVSSSVQKGLMCGSRSRCLSSMYKGPEFKLVPQNKKIHILTELGTLSADKKVILHCHLSGLGVPKDLFSSWLLKLYAKLIKSE